MGNTWGVSRTMAVVISACLLANVALGQGGGDRGSSNGSSGGSNIGYIILGVLGGIFALGCLSLICSYIFAKELSDFRKEYLERKRVDALPEEDFDNIANNFRSMLTEVIRRSKKCFFTQKERNREVTIHTQRV